MNFLKKKSNKYRKLNSKDNNDENNEIINNDKNKEVSNDDIKLDIKDDDYVIVECPHCFMKILVLKKDFNCKIFRHGVYKKTGEQIDPHMKKDLCDKLFNENKIYGCGKPYRLQVIKSKEKELYFTEICDYI